MTDQELNVFLTHAWETIATEGGVNKIEPGRPSGNGIAPTAATSRVKSISMGADAFLEYQQKYGERTTHEMLISHISGAGWDIALVETLGPNPDHAFRMFRDIAVKEATLADPVSAGKVAEAGGRAGEPLHMTAG